MENNHYKPSFNLELFCQGNNEVIVDAYKMWLPQFYLIAYRYLRSQEEAEDVVADCFEKLLKMSITDRHQKFILNKIDLKALLIVIVKNKALDVLKTKKNRIRIIDTLKNWMPTTSKNNSNASFTADDFAILFNSLSEKERKIISLNMEGYSHEEIGSQLNITEKTVSNTLSITRKKIDKLWSIFMN